VCTHAGAEEVVEDTVLEDELEVVVEGAALLEDGLSVLVEVVVGLDRTEEIVEVVETAVLMQEQPLETFEGRLEQADAHVGNATEVVARV
jgi:hypothetical protein